jgi:hypothetical protein
MSQTESSPQKPASTLKLIAIVCLRILGFRKKQFNEDEFEQLTGIQVGIACMLALIGFTAILALLSILAVKTMS